MERRACVTSHGFEQSSTRDTQADHYVDRATHIQHFFMDDTNFCQSHGAFSGCVCSNTLSGNEGCHATCTQHGTVLCIVLACLLASYLRERLWSPVRVRQLDGRSSILGPESGFQDTAHRIKQPGTRIQNPGSRVLDPGSSILDPGALIQDHRSGILELASRTLGA